MVHVFLHPPAWSISLTTNLFLFLNVFASSILCLFAFHYLYVGLECIFSCENRNWPDTRTILQYSAVSPKDTFANFVFVNSVAFPYACQCKLWINFHALKAVSIVCCVFLSHCKERPLEQRYLKDKVCSSWLAPFEFARFLESARLFEHKLIVSKPQRYHNLLCPMREKYGYHRMVWP